MKGYEFSPEAREDLQEIWGYVAGVDPEAADKLEIDIYTACEVLSRNLYLGHKRADLTDESVLFWLVRGQYLVIYQPQSQPMRIVRILHGARDASVELKY